MKQSKKHTALFISCSLLLLVIGMVLAVRSGSVPISFSDIFNSIFNYNETLELMLVKDVRIPRALCVVFTGGILGATGAMIQGVTRNPIAEPSILGVSQGATLVISIFLCSRNCSEYKKCNDSIFYRGINNRNYSTYVYIKKGNNNSIAKILLAGTAMSTFFMSLTTIIGLLSNQSQ